MQRDSMYQARRSAYCLLVLQVLVTVLSTVFLLSFVSLKAAYSGLLGGLICVVANGYFANRVFRVTGANFAKKIVMNFYRAEVMKFLLTALLFALIIKYVAVAAVPFFLTYIGTQLVLWLTPVLFRCRDRVVLV